MQIEFENGSSIESINTNNKNTRGINSKVYYLDKDTPITFSVQGNTTNRDGDYYSTEVLYNAYKDYIGKEIEGLDNNKYIVSKVDKQDDFVFITGIPVE